MSRIHEIWKGVGTTFIKGAERIIKFAHDDAGWFALGTGEKRVYVYTTAITAGVTTTTTPAGSIGLTTNATGKSQIFVSDAAHWQVMLRSSSLMAGMANLGAVAAATTTGKITQLSLNGIADGGTASGIVQPDRPRNVKLTITDGNASILTFSITVAGKAPDGTSITENFVFAGGLVQTGSKVFASVTSVTVDSITGDGAGDVLDMGYGVKLGVPVPYGAQSLVITNLSMNGSIEAAAATDQTNNSFTCTTAPDGAKLVFVWFGYSFPA